MKACVLGLALVGIMLLNPTASAQPAPARTGFHGHGTELFRGLLHYHGLEPIGPDDVDLNGANASNIVLILLGPANLVNQYYPDNLSRVILQNGGAVLLADENARNYSVYFSSDRNTFSLTGSGETVFHRSENLNGNTACPYIVPRKPALTQMLGSEWQLFAGLDRIAVNRSGTIIQHRPTQFSRNILAGFPAQSSNMTGGTGVPLLSDRVFAVGGAGTANNKFRCLALADQSVFANQMLAAVDEIRGPTDNLAFANRVVEWLVDAQGVHRKQCLFIDGSGVHRTFDQVNYEAAIMPPIPPMPVPPLPNPLDPAIQQKFTDSANESLARWQDRDGPNAALIRNPPDPNLFNRVIRFLAVTLGILLLFVFLIWLFRSSHEPNVPSVPTDTGRIAASGPPGSLARRKEEILQSGQYTQVVREYLQDLFLAQGLTRPVPDQRPSVTITGRDRKTLEQELDTLWDIAYGPDPKPILYSRWKELEPMIDEVRRAADQGRWRFAAGGTT